LGDLNGVVLNCGVKPKNLNFGDMIRTFKPELQKNPNSSAYNLKTTKPYNYEIFTRDPPRTGLRGLSHGRSPNKSKMQHGHAEMTT